MAVGIIIIMTSKKERGTDYYENKNHYFIL